MVYGGIRPKCTTLDGTLTAGIGGIAATRMGSISDSLTAFGDLYPMITPEVA